MADYSWLQELSADLPPEAKDDPDKFRFIVELEFVQCLANPHFLNSLAQRGYLRKPEFINYLDYLQYWKQSQYAQFLKFPQCLHFLDLLQEDSFRRDVASPLCLKFIEDQQLLHWHHYTKKRMLFAQKVQQKKEPQKQS